MKTTHRFKRVMKKFRFAKKPVKQPPTSASYPTLWKYVGDDHFFLLHSAQWPRFAADRLDDLLLPGDSFVATEEKRGTDGILYLRLQDARGWMAERDLEGRRLCVQEVPNTPPSGSAGV